jgi:hypothetical protein
VNYKNRKDIKEKYRSGLGNTLKRNTREAEKDGESESQD